MKYEYIQTFFIKKLSRVTKTEQETKETLTIYFELVIFANVSLFQVEFFLKRFLTKITCGMVSIIQKVQ